MQYTVCHIDNK